MISTHFIIIPTHPLLWSTLSYCAGICFAQQHTYLVSLLAFFLLFILAIFLRNCGIQRLITIFFFIAISFYAGTWRYTSVLTHYNTVSSQLSLEPFNCTGIIINIQTSTKRTFKTAITLAIHTIERSVIRESVTATIQLNLISSPGYMVGDLIKVHALKVKAPKKDAFQMYLFKEGLSASMYLPKLKSVLIERPYTSFARFLHKTQDRLVKSFAKKLSSETNALLCPLFLGRKAENSTAHLVKKYCSYWGIVHYLARSGLHVVLIVSIWGMLLRFFPLHFFIKQVLILLLILLYHALTITSISFLRALITFTLYKLFLFQNFPVRTLHVLSLTTLIILIQNPLQLFFLDFQLSFALTFALAWWSEISIKIQKFYNIIEYK